MRNFSRKSNQNKKKIIFVIIFLIILISIIIFVRNKIEEKWNNADVSNATHGVIIDDTVGFYRKPKTSKWRHIRDLQLGQNVYIIEKFTDKKGNDWYKVKADDKVGYVDKNSVDYFTFSENDEKVLMSDVSKFNLIYEHFKNSGEYEAFLLTYNINYVYIRAGGRGYGDEGNFYTDPNFKTFIDACEYLGVPYGFYYIDEAITSEEIDEEVDFINDFLNKNKTKMCMLPVVIDVEGHDGVGRADELWYERADLVTELIDKFKEKNIETIVYGNANTINEYLYTIDTDFWVAYYDLQKKIPDIWYTDTDQEPAQNQEFTDKIIGWQFTEKGIGEGKKYPVDLSIVKNEFFKDFIK